MIAASASRSGTSCQPSASTSIFSSAFTRTTSLATVASFSISVIRAPTGGFGSAAGCVLVLGRLPQFPELLVGQEHPAAVLLEDLAELLVGDVDALLADDLFLVFRGWGGGRGHSGRGRQAEQRGTLLGPGPA